MSRLLALLHALAGPCCSVLFPPLLRGNQTLASLDMGVGSRSTVPDTFRSACDAGVAAILNVLSSGDNSSIVSLELGGECRPVDSQ